LQNLSPVELALINLVLFLMAPIKARAQDAVDRIFYRRAYDAERELSDGATRSLGAYLRSSRTTRGGR
jgi:hypothetical protein